LTGGAEVVEAVVVVVVAGVRAWVIKEGTRMVLNMPRI